MGCRGSRTTHRSISLHRISSIWYSPEVQDPTEDEWADVIDVWDFLRCQGSDVDVISCAFERTFLRNPKTKISFLEAGIIDDFEEFKTHPKFRGHMREVAGSVNKILELKNTDMDAFYRYMREVSDRHLELDGFNPNFFEIYAQNLDACLSAAMGPAMSKKQAASFKKFVVYLSKLLA